MLNLILTSKFDFEKWYELY